MRRSLKAQIGADAKRVFLSMEGFAVKEEIHYWRNGKDSPYETRVIPVVVDEDANMNAVWNKNKNQQRIGHDQSLFQVEKIFFCARSDFDPPPKKGRRIEVTGLIYEVLGVTTEGGLLKVEMRRLEE
jgi:hypothetical protein